jgi:hypothetical protein
VSLPVDAYSQLSISPEQDQMNAGPIYAYYQNAASRRLSRGDQEAIGDTAWERLGYVMSDGYLKSYREQVQQRMREDNKKGRGGGATIAVSFSNH